MPLYCPYCREENVITRDHGRRLFGAIGTAAGVLTALPRSAVVVQTASLLSALTGPLGFVVGSMSAAIVTSLIAGAAGNAAGTALGAVVDANVLHNFRCLSCNATFSISPIDAAD